MRTYRTKVAEPVDLPDREQRKAYLEQADYNVFNLDSDAVFIDLLTDSGTGSMSSEQWGALLRGDEAYAGSRGFDALKEAVSQIMGFDNVVPVHQGRGGEHLLYGALLEPGDIVLNNTHFDTTRAHIAAQGATAIDCPAVPLEQLSADRPFKGDFAVETARAHIDRVGVSRIGCIILTITNNSAAGQPVSLENIDAVADLAAEVDVPFVIDACRFAENAYFNALDGAGELKDIARSQFDRADGIVMSGKKDGLANIGGFVAVRDDELFEEIRQRCILYEGFPSYGGLAGRDLEAMAVGLTEAVDPAYLAHRVTQVSELVERLDDLGVPVIRPAGGHAAFVDAGLIYSHLSAAAFPGQALVCALYREGGIRAVELGSLAFPGTDRPELVRLALPRRVYHREHIDHVVQTFDRVLEVAEDEVGFEIADAPGQPELRHFSARLQPRD